MADDAAVAAAMLARLTPTADGGYLVSAVDPNGARQFQYAIGPLELDGAVDPVTNAGSCDLHVVVPIFGKAKAASAQGDLTGGITSAVDSPVAVGTTKLYLKNGGEIWFSYDLTSLGKPLKGDAKLFTI